MIVRGGVMVIGTGDCPPIEATEGELDTRLSRGMRYGSRAGAAPSVTVNAKSSSDDWGR
jgi:hypothetical protein